ncbi:MAG: FAD-dependent oxidoreductase, partial [Candidatus Nanoarchaeia archaeon]
QIAKASEVENFPGFEKISGVELSQKMLAQAEKLGAEIEFGQVTSVNKEKNFVIKTANSKYESKTLILAYGKTPRSIGVPGEEKFAGKGVSYCANCDMPMFKNKTIAVIGGGDSALDAALYGSKIAKQVYLIHRREGFRAAEITMRNAMKAKNIAFVLNSVAKEIKGDKFVKSIVIENVNTHEIREIPVDCIFVEIGYEVKTDLVKHLVKLDNYKQIIIDSYCATSYPGVFAAGDVTNTPIKQAVVAAGEGAKAALSAYNYLQGNKLAITADWGKK